jgi:hypothetical protein
VIGATDGVADMPISDEERAEVLRRMTMADLTQSLASANVNGEFDEFEIEELIADSDETNQG